MRTEVLREVGRFDESFGSYGNEDVELFLRLRQAEVAVQYDPNAAATQEYEKDLRGLAGDTLAKGRTTVLLARKHPFVFDALRLASPHDNSRLWRSARAVLLWVTRRNSRAPSAIFTLAAWLEHLGLWRQRLFYRASLDFAFWAGVDAELLENDEGELRKLAANSTVAQSIYFYTDSPEFGGAELALLMLIEGLDREAWSPTLLLDEAAGLEKLCERACALGVPVRDVPSMPLGLVGARRVPAFARMLRAERPDIFHAHLAGPLAAKYAMMGAVAAGVPAVLATVQLIPGWELDRSSRVQLRALSAGVGRYIAVSKDVAAYLIERLHLPAHKVEVIYNSVEAERFGMSEAPALRASLTGSTSRPVILTCARLGDQKGHRFLLQAAAEIPDAIFVLAGEGPLRANLERRAGELGVGERVRFLGHRTDIPELLAASDLFALPSLYEGSSLAVLEAMAARRPVVSSAIGGTDELIDDGKTGLLVPPGDAKTLAAALRRLLGDQALCVSLAENARTRVESDFTREVMARRVEHVYENLLAR